MFANTSSDTGRQWLIVFTRYPTPGKTKTRLIPALGLEGAADLQRRMTEHVIREVRKFVQERRVRVEVRYDGSKRDMKRWLGREFRYRRQSAGDVGMRMANAFREAFEKGAQHVVLMGTDCPGTTSQIIRDAFDGLDENDVVLGPANDGGYYLIGLRRHVEELFVGVPWGTDEVMKETMHIAESRGCSVGLLEALIDVDTPEDLSAWESEERRGRKETHEERISIIIPALNESSNLRETLERIQNARDTEIIVVDGGSSDNTVEIAESYDARVIVTLAGRAKQMNAGAAAAAGDVLLFLHADTHLPDRFDEYVRRILASPENAGGAFRFSVDASTRGLRLIERLANWRSKALQLPYGDQALFIRASLFREMGGFPDVPIMEDFAFVRRLRKRGRIEIAPVPVITSARRWLRLGVWRTTLINQGVIAAYYAGVPLKTIARWYRYR
jgi:rSAM/selenodomain-associated transferase 2/rSAM/selenodomain-associated transferase 1